MKKVIFSLALLLTCSLLGYAQKGISYQAVILDPNPIEIPGQDITGQPFVNGAVSLKFKIFSSNLVQEFEEVHPTQTDAYGMVNVLIGSVSQGAFSSLVWDSKQKSLQVLVSFDQGGTYTKVSEQQLTYNPMALFAETASKLSETLSIAGGGTGATTAAAARTNLGLGNVDNTADVNKPISTATQSALATKANADEVNTALATKANAAEVNTALATKSNAAEVTSALATKANANEVTTALATKANASDVTTSLGLKEDVSNKANTPLGTSTSLYPTQNAVKTYVDAQVAGATIADANGSTKGKIQLAGDLAGTAAAPTVPGLALKLDANQKGVANGVATLNSSGIIPSSQIPPVSVSSTTVVGSDAAMTALSNATVGSIAVRTDVNRNYVLSALPASTLGNWIELLTPGAPVQTVNGYTGSVNLSKTDLGLSNVNNTSDLNKPISTATQNALDLKANGSAVDAALATKLSTADATAALALKLDANKVAVVNGVASLDASGKVPTDQIPAISFSSVKVLGSENQMLALSSAVIGSVVIRTDVNKNYVLAASNPAVLANWIELLTPAPPVQTVNGYSGNVSITKADLGLGNVQNTSDADKVISTRTQTALDTKVDKVTGKSLSTNDYSTAEKNKLAAITGTNTGDQDLSAFVTTAGLNTKVDKETGKGLSTNDYSTAEKTKLAAITGTNTGDQDLSAYATNTNLALKSPLASPSFTGTVAIGTTNPSPSAVLDVTSTSKGLLLPRLTFAQKSAIVSPEPGLIFWCTDCGTTGEMQVYNGTAYVNMIGSPAQLGMPAISSTTGMSSITSSTASSGGVISSDGGAAITARGVVWGTSTNPTIALSTKTTDGTGTGTFTSSLTGLTSGVTYYVRSYATNSVGTKYGSEISFNSLQSAPTLAATTAASSIGATTATSGGTISYNGGATVTVSGLVWSTSTAPTIELSTKTTNGTLTGTYTSAISGLTPGTLYYVRSYATNAVGTSYGAQTSFTTLTTPTLAATTAASSIASTTATSGGNISSDGGSTVSARGIVWGTATNPTTALTTKTTTGTGTGTYTSNLTGLSPATTYYVRSYATNAIGTVYGAEISFTTLAVAPTLAATTAASSIAGTTATSGGNVSSDGGAAVTARGIVWGIATSPTTALTTKTTDGSGTGVFTSSLTGLSPATLYYVRSYATNAIGTSYGAEISFTTLAVAPTLAATTAASSITGTTATSGGNITTDGGSAVTAKGIVWGTATNPTTALSTKTTDGTGSGAFTSSLTGLTAATTYYVRSYATNAIGTSYGTEISFTTLAVAPTLSTTAASSITKYAASSGGTISSNGGSVITASGICWSTSATPTISDSKTTDGTTTGTFTSSITGLTAGTTYYVRAYATNAIGTSYGAAQSFTTTSALILPAIGSSYGGGKVAYVYQSGDPGYSSSNIPVLIAASTDQVGDQAGGSVFWSNGGLSTSAQSVGLLGTSYEALGAGASNTTAINVAYGGTGNYAAKLADTYTDGTYTDWYLPSINELGKLYLNRVAIGGFTSGRYWSSSETTYATPNFIPALSWNFSSGQFNVDTKAWNLLVRAVRTTSLSPNSNPVLSATTSATSITTTTAVLGGNVTDEGATQVSARGLVYGTTTGSSTFNVAVGSGAGTFTGTLTGLAQGTTYYVRSFATNAQGTSYGAETSFTTLAVAPTLAATTAASTITGTTATSGGTISTDGGSAVTAKGVVWGTATNPTTALSTKTTDGTGSGAFTSSLTGLTAATTYYVRSYATNAIGTSYGTEISFTTLAVAPTLSTTAASSITKYAATSGGTISSNGGSVITASGICWSTSATPTTSDSKTTDGTTTGTFTSSITGLTAGTVYYVRAYATNAIGTSYGAAQSFTTLSTPVAQTTVLIGTQRWTDKNLEVTTYRNGDAITYAANATEWNTATNAGIGAWSYYNFDPANGAIYGKLYNWYAVADSRFLAPAGYHIPTTAEYNTLGTNSGSALKAASSEWGANMGTNTTGFTGLPGGNNNVSGGSRFEDQGTSGWFWTSEEDNSTPTKAYFRLLHQTAGFVDVGSYSKKYGFSVRLVKDTNVIESSPTTPILASTTSATSITTTTAVLGGNVTDEGLTQVSARGLVYGTTTGSSTFNVAVGSGAGTFTGTLTGLAQGTTYYVRSFATNAQGTAYGAETSFTTQTTPTLSATTTPTSITATSAVGGGTISSTGGATITTAGLVWDASPNPTITLTTKTTDGATSGTFTSSITGLTQDTTYHVRAYATNSVGTSYGPNITFTTLTTPTVSATATVTSITGTTATGGGTITSDGGAVTTRGVVWGTTTGSSTYSATSGTGTGTYLSNLTGLTPATTYYVRAFATNSVGTVYGPETSFVSTATAPILSTTAASSITQNTASSGGTITSNGGSAITTSGICWSTSATPTISNSKTTDGTTSGTFTSTMTGLAMGTTYYVRAYATNSIGTAYGATQSFTTLPFENVPTAANPVTNGLMLYLDATRSASYSGSGNTWADISGLTPAGNATLVGSPAFGSSSLANGSGSFTFGSNVNAVTTKTYTINNEITYIAWINPSQSFDGGVISRRTDPSFNGGHTSLYLANSNLCYDWDNSKYGWRSNLMVPNNQWSMIVITVNAGSVTAYLCNASGISSATNGTTHDSLTSRGATNFHIGYDPYSPTGRAVKGKMGTAMVYSVALTSADITAIFNAQKASFGL